MHFKIQIHTNHDWLGSLQTLEIYIYKLEVLTTDEHKRLSKPYFMNILHCNMLRGSRYNAVFCLQTKKTRGSYCLYSLGNIFGYLFEHQDV